MAPQGNPVTFLDLPAELRNRIYHFALVPANRQLILQPHTVQEMKACGLLTIGGQIEREATPIYFGGNNFRVMSIKAARRFLKHAGPERRALIRRWELPCYLAQRPARVSRVKNVLAATRAYLKAGGTGALPADVVFVRIDGDEAWVRLTEVPEFEVVRYQGEGWWVTAKMGEASS